MRNCRHFAKITLILTIFYLLLTGCSNDKSPEVFEGFRLGERFDRDKVKSKFGEYDTWKLYTMRLNETNPMAVVDVRRLTWDYKFTNDARGFVSFYTVGDSIIYKIVVQVGSIEQKFPNTYGYDHIYSIFEKAWPPTVDFLTKSLEGKYGKPTRKVTDDWKRTELYWDFPKYQVCFIYDPIDHAKAKIRYELNKDIVEAIEQKSGRNNVTNQSKKF